MIAQRLAFFAVASAILAAAPGARAGEVLVDFSDGQFPNGEGPVFYGGIRFTNEGGGTGGSGMTGTNDWGFYFSNIPGGSYGPAFNDGWGDSQIWMDFPEGTRTVSLLASTGVQTRFALDFYGADGTLLGTSESLMPDAGLATHVGGEGFNVDISRVRFYEPDGENGHISLIDDIRYSDVGSCRADLDGNGELDLFDFLAFTNRFNSEEPDADWNGDGVFDLFDFLGFVNSFNEGC